MKALTLPLTPTRHRRFNELVGLVLLLLAALSLLALVSYRPGDPSFDTAGGGAVHNWTGPMGAWSSDLLLQLTGAAAFALPLLLASLGWLWLRSRAGSSPWIRIAGLLLSVLVIPTAFALVPGHFHLFGSLPLGGVLGALLADALVAWLNFPGACVTVLFCAAVAGYLLTAFTLTSARQWVLVRFAVFAAMRDRYSIWRRTRRNLRAERRATREAEAAEQEDFAEEEQPVSPQEPLFQIEHAYAIAQDEAPIRRGGFAEVSEDRRPVATGWNEDTFAADIAAIPFGAALPKNQPLAPIPFPATPAETADDLPNFQAEPLRPALVERREVERREVERPRTPEHVHSIASAPTPMPRPEPVSDDIAFGTRADLEVQGVTRTSKSVAGFESAFKLPPTTLLHRSEEAHAIREEEMRLEAQVLVEKCAEFGVGGQITQINPGPVVTTFELRPDAGVKYSRVTGLAEDLCLAMAAESILIERMAGKSTVGIQVPNHDRETIWLRDVVECESFATSKSRITMAMGKDINGRIVIADLATMPHVLIAGSTGSGKSVAINAMIMSVLFKATPEQVRLILVDPKRVELGMYDGIPHLFTPIITEPKLAANALKNAVREMERRLKLLASRSVRNLDQYNKLFDEYPALFDEQGVEEKPLPYIMIIIDELADLMILDRANVEEAITRLAQMARAVGIHLVLATQRPSVDVITGLIKANVPTRMSFRLATKIDSRTILDANGAESLLGRGDMLFLPPGTSRLQRVHAPFVTEKEISAVTSFWKAQAPVEYHQGFLEAPKDERGRELDVDGNPEDENDPLYDDAVRLVFEFGKASTSLLQRRMRIGYGRAAHLIDLMERDGLVGPPEGSKPREILKRADWLNESDESAR